MSSHSDSDDSTASSTSGKNVMGVPAPGPSIQAKATGNTYNAEPSSTGHIRDPEYSSPTMSFATTIKLRERDRKGVAYSKALLLDGDTIVIIEYPGTGKLYDASGFKLVTNRHLVHSSKLLATGSSRFKELFSPIKQARTLRRAEIAKYLDIGKLPKGINYILDLTPPSEGEDAVFLTTQLSCSVGICHWFKSERICCVSPVMVGGKDEVTEEQMLKSTSKSELPNLNDNSKPNAKSEDEAHLTSTPPSHVPASASNSLSEDNALRQALKLSKEEYYLSTPEAQFEYLCAPVDIQEYSAVRHRSGIIKLLQIIEGKEPPLDSAPKVWTLFALAKWFNCPQVVCDYIVRWLTAEPNCRILEILPEKSFEMGMGLESVLIVRPAFAVLVSEEALSIASQRKGKKVGGPSTQLHRLREDLDEEYKQMIQYAGTSFHEAITTKTNELLNCSFFSSLDEYLILQNLESEINSHENAPEEWMLNLRTFQDELQKHVSARLLKKFLRPLGIFQAKEADRRRMYEQYLYPWEQKYADIYDSLSVEERSFTIHPWYFIIRLSSQFNMFPSPCDYLDEDWEPEEHTEYVGLRKLELSRIQLAKVPNCPEFSLQRFFHQVADHIFNFCKVMMKNKDDFLWGQDQTFKVTEHILCLDNEQYKYLPIWAGGQNDGSYSIFTSDIPEADTKFAPSGPGPSYHGADSTFSSQPSSMMDFEGSSVGTSVAVENGLPGHIDRRRVKSMDSRDSTEASSECFTLIEDMSNCVMEDQEDSSDTETLRASEDDDFEDLAVDDE